MVVQKPVPGRADVYRQLERTVEIPVESGLHPDTQSIVRPSELYGWSGIKASPASHRPSPLEACRKHCVWMDLALSGQVVVDPRAEIDFDAGPGTEEVLVGQFCAGPRAIDGRIDVARNPDTERIGRLCCRPGRTGGQENQHEDGGKERS